MKPRTVFHEIWNQDGAATRTHVNAYTRAPGHLAEPPPVGEKLSSGSTSTVHRSADACAIKRVTGPDAKTTLTEISFLTALSHPNIIKILTIAFMQDGISIVMPYYKCDLSFLLRETLRMEHVQDITKGIAAALEYIHARGVIHSDIKPANIFAVMANEMSLKVIVADFGLSRLINSPPALHYVQTPVYRAPEVIVGAVITPAVDIWSLGVIIAEMGGMRVSINTDDGTQYACEYYGMSRSASREVNIASITAAPPDTHAKAIALRLSGAKNISPETREACIGALRFNSRTRLRAGDIMRLLTQSHIVTPLQPFVRGPALESVENRILTREYPGIVPSTLHAGAKGLAKVLCGRLPELTDDEFACAKKLSAAARGQIL